MTLRTGFLLFPHKKKKALLEGEKSHHNSFAPYTAHQSTRLVASTGFCILIDRCCQRNSNGVKLSNTHLHRDVFNTNMIVLAQ